MIWLSRQLMHYNQDRAVADGDRADEAIGWGF